MPPSWARPAHDRKSRTESIYTWDLAAMSEDCLSLNIWAPAQAQEAPVFVGIQVVAALTSGAGSQPLYDGILASRNEESSSSRSTTALACSAISRIRR